MTITTTSINNNTASYHGGGIRNLRGMTVQGSSFSNNTATNTNGNGGGIFHGASTGTMTITNSSFTGNSAGGSGGGIFRDGSLTFAVTYSDISGNTSGSGGTGLHNQTITSAVDATHNWWGCDSGPGGVSCDTISSNVTFNPWLSTIPVTANPATQTIGGTVQVNAKVQDNNGVEDIGSSGVLKVRFARTGANPGTADENISNGEANHSYSGNNAGADTVTAVVLFGGQPSTLEGGTAVTWNLPPTPTPTLVPGLSGPWLAVMAAILIGAFLWAYRRYGHSARH